MFYATWIKKKNYYLGAWLKTHNSTRWSEGLRFVQFTKNRTYHSGIGCSPYEAMFGTPAKLGLQSSSLPSCEYEGLETEEQLEQLLEPVTENVSGIMKDVEKEPQAMEDIENEREDTENEQEVIQNEQKVVQNEQEVVEDEQEVEEDENNVEDIQDKVFIIFIS